MELDTEIFNDPRVQKAIYMANRDRSIRRRFEELRQTRQTVRAIFKVLADEFCIGTHHLSSIIYRKRY